MTNMLKFTTCLFHLTLTAALLYGVWEWESWKTGKLKHAIETDGVLQRVAEETQAANQRFTEKLKEFDAVVQKYKHTLTTTPKTEIPKSAKQQAEDDPFKNIERQLNLR